MVRKRGKFSGVWMRKENGHEHVRLYDKERICGYNVKKRIMHMDVLI